MNKIALMLIAGTFLTTAALSAIAQDAPAPAASVTTSVTSTTDVTSDKTVTSQTVVVDNPNIIEAAIRNAELNTFTSLVAASGLTATLQTEGPYTVFAPDNAAFAKIPAAKLEEWSKPENKEKLAALLKHHIVKGLVGSPEVKGKVRMAATLQEDEVRIDGQGDAILLDNVAKVVTPDFTVKNGIVHVVDTVIVPKDMQ